MNIFAPGCFVFMGVAFAGWILFELVFNQYFKKDAKKKEINDKSNVITVNIENPEVNKKEMEGDGVKKDVKDEQGIIFDSERIRKIFRLCSMAGIVLLLSYVTDVAGMFGIKERVYERDVFFSIMVLLFVCGAFTIKKVSRDGGVILNRDQTEEWRGWMQVWFVMYHYYNAKEVYNLIRVLVSSYVWMTGFGNFSYFWIRKDYSFVRWWKMMFRMGFLVSFLCIFQDTNFMLYYICALHMLWFNIIFFVMKIFSEKNYVVKWMTLKFILLFLGSFLMWDFLDLNTFEIIWLPLKPILGIDGSLYEWMFRSKLDHLIAIWGMICAYFHPNYQAFLLKIEADSFPRSHRLMIKFGIIGTVLLVLFFWAKFLMLGIPDKYEYNVYHPYTSWIPITCYIALRNIFPIMRQYHSVFLAFIGKMTLETYLLQFHVFLGNNARSLTDYLGPDYPILNCVVATSVLAIVGKVGFEATVQLNALTSVYGEKMSTILHRLFFVSAVGGITCICAFFITAAAGGTFPFYPWSLIITGIFAFSVSWWGQRFFTSRHPENDNQLKEKDSPTLPLFAPSSSEIMTEEKSAES